MFCWWKWNKIFGLKWYGFEFIAVLILILNLSATWLMQVYKQSVKINHNCCHPEIPRSHVENDTILYAISNHYWCLITLGTLVWNQQRDQNGEPVKSESIAKSIILNGNLIHILLPTICIFYQLYLGFGTKGVWDPYLDFRSQ